MPTTEPVAGPIPVRRLMDFTLPIRFGDSPSGLAAPNPFGMSLLRDSDVVFAVEADGSNLRAVTGGEVLHRAVSSGFTGNLRFATVAVTAGTGEFEWLLFVARLLEGGFHEAADEVTETVLASVEAADPPNFSRPVPVHSLMDPSKPFPAGEFETLGGPTRAALEMLRDADVVWALDAVYPMQRVAVKGRAYWAEFIRRLHDRGLTATADVVFVELDFDGVEYGWLRHAARAANDPTDALWDLV